MRVKTGAHPIVEGVEDFAIADELYVNFRFADAIDPLIESDWEGEARPVLWVRHYGGGRICYNALGHGPEAFENPSFRRLVQRGALWVLGRI